MTQTNLVESEEVRRTKGESCARCWRHRRRHCHRCCRNHQVFFIKGSLSGPLAFPFPDFPLFGGAVSFGDGAPDNPGGPSAAVAPLSEPGASPGPGSDAVAAGASPEGWLLSATPYLDRSIHTGVCTEWSTYSHRKSCGEINPGRNAIVGSCGGGGGGGGAVVAVVLVDCTEGRFRRSRHARRWRGESSIQRDRSVQRRRDPKNR